MRHLRFNEIYQCTNIMRNFRENRPEFPHLADYSTLRLVFGHFVHEEMLRVLTGPVQIFMGLREPHARFRSQLFFMARLRKQQGLPAVSMQEEVDHKDNGMCRAIVTRFPALAGEGTLAERALKVLDHCWCVYFSERFEESAAPIFQALDITPIDRNWNVGEYDETGLDEDVDFSAARLDQDLILYETALQRFAVQRPVSPECAERLATFRAEPPNQAKFHKSFYRATFQQFQTNGALADVIAHRKRVIAEMQAELLHYAERLKAHGG
ncbi:MAG TPA: hypothetical protein VGF97_17035 [Rhizomicrobium sp.]|jgi:hypothetical protein